MWRITGLYALGCCLRGSGYGFADHLLRSSRTKYPPYFASPGLAKYGIQRNVMHHLRLIFCKNLQKIIGKKLDWCIINIKSKSWRIS
jgi:hypothetical protein